MTTPLTSVLRIGGVAPADLGVVIAPPEDVVPPAGTAGGTESSLPASRTDPVQRWAPSTAVLEVHRDGDHFQVCGKHPEVELPTTGGDRYGRPKLALGTMVAPGGAVPEDLLYYLKEWSRTHDEITGWINALRVAVGDALRLVVWDDTGFEIPWELLWLPESAPGGLTKGWLGALLPVVRWTTIHATSAVSLSYSDSACDAYGELVAYLVKEMAGDEEVLRRFSTVNSTDSVGLVLRMRVTAPSIGLVYVASHGAAEATVVRRRLGDLRLVSVSGDTLDGLSSSRSLVFLNACHSGRLFLDPHLGDSLLRGFAQAFLNQGASAVIGTSGEVETGRARHVARELLEAMTGAGRPSVAVALRDIRARAAAGVPVDTDDQRVLLPFLTTFMYVCYGNAHTTLTLAREGGSS